MRFIATYLVGKWLGWMVVLVRQDRHKLIQIKLTIRWVSLLFVYLLIATDLCSQSTIISFLLQAEN